MQVVNLGDNPKTHQLGWRSKGRQRYRSELQSCSQPEAREPRDVSTNTLPSSVEGINSGASACPLCLVGMVEQGCGA